MSTLAKKKNWLPEIEKVERLFSLMNLERKIRMYKKTCQVANELLAEGIEGEKEHTLFLSWEILASNMSIEIYENEE